MNVRCPVFGPCPSQVDSFCDVVRCSKTVDLLPRCTSTKLGIHGQRRQPYCHLQRQELCILQRRRMRSWWMRSRNCSCTSRSPLRANIRNLPELKYNPLFVSAIPMQSKYGLSPLQVALLLLRPRLLPLLLPRRVKNSTGTANVWD